MKINIYRVKVHLSRDDSGEVRAKVNDLEKEFLRSEEPHGWGADIMHASQRAAAENTDQLVIAKSTLLKGEKEREIYIEQKYIAN